MRSTTRRASGTSRPRRRLPRTGLLLGLMVLLTACSGEQSMLEPEGPFAQQPHDLFVIVMLIALAVFVLVRAVKRASEEIQDEFGQADAPDQPATKKCAYCREAVPFAASRCSHCTSFLGTDGGPLQPDAALTPGPAQAV